MHDAYTLISYHEMDYPHTTQRIFKSTILQKNVIQGHPDIAMMII